jgi:ATP-binding cassette subfamily B protein
MLRLGNLRFKIQKEEGTIEAYDKVLCRAPYPDEGDLLINDTNLKEINLSQLKTHIAIALQQNVLFAATVAENIGYATRGASRAAIESAATVACANTFIEEMSRSYDTELGERGGKLSTGQRQRLSIARAIVRDTPILILDEPTASLDAETEHQVLANLAEWGRERIVFLITHRLSTIRNADTIAFLEDGRIVETGSHDELMQMPDGRYRRFVQAETSGSDTP